MWVEVTATKNQPSKRTSRACMARYRGSSSPATSSPVMTEGIVTVTGAVSQGDGAPSGGFRTCGSGGASAHATDGGGGPVHQSFVFGDDGPILAGQSRGQLDGGVEDEVLGNDIVDDAG